MKESNPLENRLRSWMPRAPSERIRQRLFGRADARPAGRPKLVWPWLAPVTVALFMSVMLLSHSRQGLTYLTGGPAAGNAVTARWSTPYLASALYVASPQNDRNAWTKATFEWTNRSHSLTTPPDLDNLEFAPAKP